jgi:thiosulfate/3-mercaptopyruvate sulfurtransferase
LPEVTVLDVRFRISGPSGWEEYAAGHVPGAAYVDLDRDLAAPPGSGGRHPLPERAAFGAAMRGAGVRADRPVVVYDDWTGLAAGRCWWLLRHHGHPAVRVLNGAWPAWLGAGGPVATGEETTAPGDFEAGPGVLRVVDADGVPQVGVLIDARAPERFRGEVEPLDPIAGHIPGAVNVPTISNLDETGRFRTPGELASVYAEAGAVPGADVAAYCGSGITATHDLIALELIGVEAALYPGSWSGWITDKTRPIAP